MGETDATVMLKPQGGEPSLTGKTHSKGNLFQRLLNVLKNIFGIKLLLIVMAAVLFFLEGVLPLIPKVDDGLFRVSSFLKGTPVVKNVPTVITVSAEQAELLRKEPENFPGMVALLKKVSHVKPSVIALIVDELPLLSNDMPVEAIENKISGMIEKAKPGEKKKLEQVLAYTEKFRLRGRILADRLSKVNAVVAFRQIPLNDRGNAFSGYYLMPSDLAVKPAPVNTYLDSFPPSALPWKTPEITSETNIRLNVSSVFSVPVGAGASSTSWPLVWKQGERLVPDIVTRMYARMINDDPLWQRGYGMMFGFAFTGTDGAGYVKPYLSMKDAEKHLKTFTMSEIMALSNLSFMKGRPVIIGDETDSLAVKSAVALMSLSSGAVSSTPHQAVLLSKCLIIAMLLYLLFVVPMFRPGVSILISLMIVFSALMVQFGIHLIKNQWLLLLTPVVFMMTGHVLMLIRQSVRAQVSTLINRAENAQYELGLFQYEQGRYDQAFDTLKKCRTGNRVLELLYKLGVSLERKRQFDKACSVFDYIVRHNPDHRDSKEKTERLANLVFGRTTGNMDGNQGHLTLASPGMPRPVLGRYEVERELGRGAMGIVYLGVDPKIGRKIAIKTMDFTQTFEGRFDEVKDRFFREAMAAGRLAHPNIVTIYDAGEEQDLAYIAMDFVTGEPLSSYTTQETLLPFDVVFDLIAQVADALDYAHKQSIIHRDIKPGNIIYDPEGKIAKVTDFGIARIADTTTTRPGVVVGSPSFMSPEQLKGSDIDGRADIFSLGVTFYQLLTGKLPFTGTDLSSLGYQITSVRQPSVLSLRPELPKSAETVIARALQKQPDKRYKTAAGMARTLRSEINRS